MMQCRTVEEFENNVSLDSNKIDGKIINILQVNRDITQPQRNHARVFYVVLSAKINSDYLVCLKKIHDETIYPEYDDFGLGDYQIEKIASMLESEVNTLKEKFINLGFNMRDRIDGSILKELNLSLFKGLS